VLDELPVLYVAAVGVAWPLLGSPRNGRQRYTCSKNIYCFGSKFIAPVTVDVFEKDRNCLMVHAQCLPSKQLTPPPPQASTKWSSWSNIISLHFVHCLIFHYALCFGRRKQRELPKRSTSLKIKTMDKVQRNMVTTLSHVQPSEPYGFDLEIDLVTSVSLTL
jgi:hypothetical protein